MSTGAPRLVLENPRCIPVSGWNGHTFDVDDRTTHDDVIPYEPVGVLGRYREIVGKYSAFFSRNVVRDQAGNQ